MQDLNLPSAELKVKRVNDGIQIFDILRKKYLVLTQEEWVRQRFLHFLIHHKGFHKDRMAIEMGIEINGMKRRCDLVYYNRQGRPILIVECKAASIKLNQDVFDQIARYNLKLDVPVLIVTNGLDHIACTMDQKNERYIFLKDIPDASSIEGF